mmetsp:Transcript_4312/g.4455  ORF Transcript_4312/g.4455 Transcript_4312/m.4455 type:complete len:199 (+) Transcript_4312:1-597(+)
MSKMIAAYKSVKIGDPLEEGVFCGPLHNKLAVKSFLEGVSEAQSQGGKLLYGGTQYTSNTTKNGNFVVPAIVEIDMKAEICQREIFAPLLYVSKISSFDEGVAINNSVNQGLSSALFTNRIDLMHKWTGPLGADTGLVNINCGTSGAEIGGAFGGEKETGGGRESGGEAWRQYMRQTGSCVNHGNKVHLAQGIVFPKF